MFITTITITIHTAAIIVIIVIIIVIIITATTATAARNFSTWKCLLYFIRTEMYFVRMKTRFLKNCFKNGNREHPLLSLAHECVGQRELLPGGAKNKTLVCSTSQQLQYSMVLHICH